MKTSYSRLKPSRIEGAGVGVFSINFIPKGTDPVSYTHLTLPTNREV